MSAAVRPDPDAEPATPVATLYLHPGEIHVTALPTRLTTILGSCVSVCLFDARANVAEGERHIGTANVELARAALERQGIAIGAEDVGGLRGRKLVFAAPDGAAWVKVIGP